MSGSTIGPIQQRASQIFLEHSDFVRFVAYETAPLTDCQGDIVNDCFIEFIEKAERWDYESDFHPLLRQMTRNIAMRYWRDYTKSLPENRQRLAYHIQMLLDRDPDHETMDRLEQEKAALDLCLKKLTPDNRRLVELFYFNHLSFIKIADLFHQTANALRKRMGRIREVLRSCLNQALGSREIESYNGEEAHD